MPRNFELINLSKLFRYVPNAVAIMEGSSAHPDIYGMVRFYQTAYGVVVNTKLEGLPQKEGECEADIFAIHIHEGESCTGNNNDPFSDALMHYNPYNCPHPSHAGDMPPIFGCNGLGISVFLTNRFKVEEIVGRTVILHGGYDDFTTQPSGNAGTKIACGKIQPTKR